MPGFLEPGSLLLLFIAACFAGMALLARVAGWPSLAAAFRARGVPAGETLRFVTGSLGAAGFPIKYRNCLHLALTPDGFYVSLMFPFKFASPALFVPWAQVESCSVEQVFSTQIVDFRFRNQWAGLKLRGVAGQLTCHAYQRYRASHEPSGGQPLAQAEPGKQA